MNALTREIPSVQALHELAAFIAARLPGGVIIGLSGPLGAGKTEFVRGVCIAGSIAQSEVSSPSYVLEQCYSCANAEMLFRQVSHWDLYRLRSGVGHEVQMTEVLDQILDSGAAMDTVVLVEWPERIAELRRHLSLHIGFAHVADEARLLTIEINDPALSVGLANL